MKKENKAISKPVLSTVGRPTKYYSELTLIAHKLALLGLTDKEIAQTLNVSKSTLNTWKKEHSEFLDSLIRGKTVADGNVVFGLYQRAVGIEYVETTRELVEGELTITKEVTKFIPPDAGAALSFLKNRQPNLWRDKQQIEHSGTMTVTMDLDGGDKGGLLDDPVQDQAEDTDFEEVEDKTNNDE